MALIKIDPGRTVGPVDRRILGGFAEHLGRCIYGGIFDEGSPLSDGDGYRRDVREAVQQLKPPLLRWPGGNFVSAYHFTDGLGPPEARPRRYDVAWRKEESNRFGTTEFLAYCELIGTEPYLCVNMGTGTLDEAQAWVEYCNGTGDTYWANKRREHGHPDPWNVRYWGLGNEMYGSWQVGALAAEDYVKRAREFAKVMTATDPSIELVSCGSVGWGEWDRVVIDGLAPLVRFHSVHIYTGSADYWVNLLAPLVVERCARVSGAYIENARFEQKIEHEIHLAYDEWNVWYRVRENDYDEIYDLTDALAIATYLHAFVRHGDVIRIANMAQLVNVLAPIMASPDGVFRQTIFHPLRLFADHLGDRRLDVHVECDRHELDAATLADPAVGDFASGVPLLDAVATLGPENRLMLSVVNRSPDHDVAAELRFAESIGEVTASVEVLNGPDVAATNSLAEPGRVEVTKTTRPLASGQVHGFPAHSLTVITLPIS